MYFAEWNYIMTKFVMKSETFEDGAKVLRYYFLGKFPFLKKIKGTGVRKTFLFNYCISKHSAKVVKNSLDYSNLLMPSEVVDLKKHKIDIIIPVYNGFDYLPDLFNSINQNTDVSFRLIVVNDHSPDARVLEFLLQQKNISHNEFILLNNEQNLGFVQSVNKAFQYAQNDVVLMNTDVVLPKNWASRLLLPLVLHKNVASVTPFSNAATIFSLPVMGADNAFDADLEKVNTALLKLNALYHLFEFPTGVGFCMAIKKEVLDKIGPLDLAFEKGYREENDWCQRAVNAGYVNTLAYNLFIWHKHGGSFDALEKKSFINKHSKIINQRYPNYSYDVKSIFKNQDYISLHFLAEILYFSTLAEKTQVWWRHSWGGGAEIYALRKIQTLKEKNLIISLQEDVNFALKCTYSYKNFQNCIYLSYQDALALFSNIQISDLVVNNLAGYENIPMTLDFIHKLKNISKAKVSFRGHDFQCICPNITLVDYHNVYCQCRDLSLCPQCIFRSASVLIKTDNVKKYQNAWCDFLQNVADEIVVFSQSSADILCKAYNGLTHKIKIIPHTIPDIRKVVIKPHRGLNVCVLGNISPAKGANILKELDLILPKFKNVHMFLAGNVGFSPKNIKLLGQYKFENLASLMEKNFIDFILIPSVWPETFSYTTEEAMTMGLPVACYDLGAPAERVKKYKKGLIISKIDAQTTLNEIEQFFQR